MVPHINYDSEKRESSVEKKETCRGIFAIVTFKNNLLHHIDIDAAF